MCENKEKVKLPDLILAAVCEMQEKNGVQACEIAEFVAKKRGCKMSQIEGMIKVILCKAKNYGILCEKKGLYRIEEKYDDLPGREREKAAADVNLSESDDDEDDDEEDENKAPDPCVCLKFSKECLDDDEEEENRCPGIKKKKKRKQCS